LPKIDIRSSFRIWHGRKCFMAAWIHPLSWPLGHLNKHRLVIYADVVGSFYNGFWEQWGDDGWPHDLRPEPLPAETPTTSAEDRASTPPLALLEALLFGEPVNEEGARPHQRGLSANRVGFRSTEANGYEITLRPAEGKHGLAAELAALAPDLRDSDLIDAELVYAGTPETAGGTLHLIRPGKQTIDVTFAKGKTEDARRYLAAALTDRR